MLFAVVVDVDEDVAACCIATFSRSPKDDADAIQRTQRGRSARGEPKIMREMRAHADATAGRHVYSGAV